MALTKPKVGTRIRHVSFHGDDNGQYDYLDTEEIYGTVIPSPVGYSPAVANRYLDVLFDDGETLLYTDDSEFEVVS